MRDREVAGLRRPAGRGPSPSEPTTTTSGSVATSRSSSATVAVGGQADDEQPGLLVVLERAGQVGAAGDRQPGGRAGRGAPGGGGHAGRAALGHEHALRAEGGGRADDGAEVARVGDAVERDEQRAPARRARARSRSSGCRYSYGGTCSARPWCSARPVIRSSSARLTSMQRDAAPCRPARRPR